jgi:hypothetical protein
MRLALSETSLHFSAVGRAQHGDRLGDIRVEVFIAREYGQIGRSSALQKLLGLAQ